ncbi:MAG TPA: adenylyl-sulfate kinase [Bacteroidia bacterium]|nr:adenylyl-sulfate kinase [Bacteroidia bacterium]HNS12223.1 adenylyl-sulfate kinase [Bacteroidia bacterium]
MGGEANLFSPHHRIQKDDRCKLLGQNPVVIWFTGLSGSGKSTLAGLLEEELFKSGVKTTLLDGDILRQGLNKDLGFEKTDREENIRRIGEVCRLMNQSGLVTIAAFISPFKKEREWLRSLFPSVEFVEVFVDTSLEVCEERDPNGLYRLAREGKIKNFTGIDSVYEVPENPDIVISTAGKTAETAVEEILKHVIKLIRRV